MFEQLIEQQMVWFENSILNGLHYHTISNMFFDGIFETYCAWILSCFSLKANI
jgi:hypothetical protein